jgi:hypothetical protein
MDCEEEYDDGYYREEYDNYEGYDDQYYDDRDAYHYERDFIQYKPEELGERMM